MTTPADDLLSRALAGDAFLLFDGAMGTMLQAAGMAAGAVPELLVLEDPSLVEGVHRAYVEAGADVITACTFGANARKLAGKATVAEVFSAACALARSAGARYVAADMGPTGSLLEPLGPLTVEECERLYREQAEAVAASDADLVIVETMGDLLEAKCALRACREVLDIPVVVTMTFGEDGLTFLGTLPEVAVATLCAAGAAAVGVNCSLGPDRLAPVVAAMAPYSRVPLVCQANAGLPRMEGDRTVYDVGADEYAASAARLIAEGATILGGCCGTSADHIAALRALIDRSQLPPRRYVPALTVTGSRRLVSLPAGGDAVAVVGERINPTGKRRLKEALRAGDYDYLVDEALAQRGAGADILDVNAGLPEVDEPAVLAAAVDAVQFACDLPLQLDSTDPNALDAACRRYSGKPLINSVNGTEESLAAVLPVAARHGAAVVALTLDEDGIPATAERRVAIARRIVERAVAAGIAAEDVAVDCLAMAASTDQTAPGQILEAIRSVRAELPVQATLGVSNISFGLPCRPVVNAAFLSEAFGAGLTMPIVNPLDQRIADAVAVRRVMCGQDAGARAFIEANAGRTVAVGAAPAPAGGAGTGTGVPGADGASGAPAAEAAPDDALTDEERARQLVLAGRPGPMGEVVDRLLARMDPLAVVDGVLVPALDEVGDRFEAGTMFLPQLMASAEAAGAGFERVRAAMPEGAAGGKGRVIVATVKGDIHDIGKNIVRMILENHGYDVVDLGRDVEPAAVLAAVEETGIRVVGLSALMTTTVRAMEETIALLREKAPGTFVFVGGAVLNPEYAEMVGADAYAKDAAESARILGELFSERPDLR